MRFQALSGYLEKLEDTSSRLELTRLLAQLIKEVPASEIDHTVNLLLGQLAPSYQNIVFNLADRMMLKALAQAYDRPLKEVRELYKSKGDLGIVAELLNPRKSSHLSVAAVYQKLLTLAQLEGEGSQDQKVSQMADLLHSLDRKSSRYVARIPVGKLRLGFSYKTIIDALSWYLSGDKSHSKEIEEAYNVMPDIGRLSLLLKKKGLKNLARAVNPSVATPVKPMLAQRLKSPDEMIKKMGEVAVEPKFDGLRVLIHFSRGNPPKAYSRNLNEISDMFPELNSLSRYLRCKSAVLDTEAVGLDPDTMRMVNFQRTMKRRRKHAISQTSSDIPLRFQVFDLLFKNGQSFMQKPYVERRQALAACLKKNKTFVVDEYHLTDQAADIRRHHQHYLAQGLEGAMIKKADAAYVPGRTGFRWVKLKEVEEAHGKLADTIDVVILGYSRGRGKRAQFGVGQFLAGIRSRKKFLTITKVGTGLSEAQLQDLAQKLQELKASQRPASYKVHKDLEPDFWVKPRLVVELAGDELTQSPKHTAGLALRFPRLIKFRPDKSTAQATTLSEIQNLYRLQKQ